MKGEESPPIREKETQAPTAVVRKVVGYTCKGGTSPRKFEIFKRKNTPGHWGSESMKGAKSRKDLWSVHVDGRKGPHDKGTCCKEENILYNARHADHQDATCGKHHEKLQSLGHSPPKSIDHGCSNQ